MIFSYRHSQRLLHIQDLAFKAQSIATTPTASCLKDSRQFSYTLLFLNSFYYGSLLKNGKSVKS